jgi:hypothetical protein
MRFLIPLFTYVLATTNTSPDLQANAVLSKDSEEAGDDSATIATGNAATDRDVSVISHSSSCTDGSGRSRVNSMLSRLFRLLRHTQTLEVAEGLLTRVRDRLLVGLALRLSALKVKEAKEKVKTHMDVVKAKVATEVEEAHKEIAKLSDKLPEEPKIN